MLAGARRAEAAERTLDVCERLGDSRRAALAYLNLTIAYHQMAKFSDAAESIDRALVLFREIGAERSLYYASALGWRAQALIGLGRLEEARDHFLEDIALHEALGDDERAGLERFNFAELEFAAGDARRALMLTEEGLDGLRASGLEAPLRLDFVQAAAYLNAAAYQLVLGEVEAARVFAREGLARARKVQYPLFVAIAVQYLATVAALRDEVAIAARLRGFVDRVYAAGGARREPTEQRTEAILLNALREQLGETEMERLAAQGALLTEEDILWQSFAIAEAPRS